MPEYFTQRRALDQIALDPAAARTSRRTLVLKARQKREAAEATIAVSVAEALVLIRDCVLLFGKAVKETAGEQTIEARYASFGVDSKTARHLETTLAGLADRTLPELEANVGEADPEFFGELVGVASVLNRALSPKILLESEIRARRLNRGIVAGLAAFAIVLGLYVEFRPLPCRASGFLVDEFKADMAIDGVVGTEWLLPDGKDGWLDVRVHPSRTIRLVHLTNGHNRTSNDRAIRAYRLEAYSGRRLVSSASGEFPALLPAPPPVEVPLTAKDVDRVRLVVISWFGAGGALAEIKVE